MCMGEIVVRVSCENIGRWCRWEEIYNFIGFAELIRWMMLLVEIRKEWEESINLDCLRNFFGRYVDKVYIIGVCSFWGKSSGWLFLVLLKVKGE